MRPCRLLCVLALAFGGCYMDATAGVARAGGGVVGYGWELGLAFGFGWDIGGVIRASAGYGADMTHVGASDGKYGTTGMALNARADVAVAKSKASSVRAVLQYGHGGHDELHFIEENDPNRYIGHSTSHSFFLGIAQEWYTDPGTTDGVEDVSGTEVSYGIGPHVTWRPNDFVGDTVTVGLQAHVGFWWFPVFIQKATGSLWEHASDPTPIRPRPTGTPIPTCQGPNGENPHPCY